MVILEYERSQNSTWPLQGWVFVGLDVFRTSPNSVPDADDVPVGVIALFWAITTQGNSSNGQTRMFRIVAAVVSQTEGYVRRSRW